MSPTPEDTLTAEAAGEQAGKKAQAATQNGHSNAAPKPTGPRSVWQVVHLSVEHIGPSPFQPRLIFDPLEMEDLVTSVRFRGVQQPIIVRTTRAIKDTPSKEASGNGAKGTTAKNGHHPSDGNGRGTDAHHTNGNRLNAHSRKNPHLVRYDLIVGERRLRACREAKRRFIPAIIRDDLSDAEAAELSLIENVQRSNLSVIEEAKGYKKLMLSFRMSEERIAKKVGKSVATIRETMKLLALPEAVQRLLAEKKLSASHGQQLLRLAPFERVCVLTAQKAVDAHLTATSLSSTPLPDVRDLQKKKLIVELGYKTQFNWREECGNCPHKAYVKSGFSSHCLKPEEYKRKNDAAALMKKQEAARVMEEAKQAGRGTVDLGTLPVGSYRDLSYNTPPPGCNAQCPCRGEASDPRDPTRKVAVCLDASRFQELRQAERQAHEEMRRRHLLVLWDKAHAMLLDEREQGKQHKVALLLARPVLLGNRHRYGNPEVWQTMVQDVGKSLDIALDWEKLFDAQTEEAEALVLLQSIEPAWLLLLTACVLLLQEAQEAVRFGGATPNLDFLLGRKEEQQAELAEQEEPMQGDMASQDGMAPSESFSNEADEDEYGDEDIESAQEHPDWESGLDEMNEWKQIHEAGGDEEGDCAGEAPDDIALAGNALAEDDLPQSHAAQVETSEQVKTSDIANVTAPAD